MRKIIAIVLLAVIVMGISLAVREIPFGKTDTKVGEYYLNEGKEETGAANIVTSVVVNYRGFDTLGEIAVLFTAAIGLGAVFGSRKKKKDAEEVEKSSLIVYTGCRFLFPVILLVGAYIFIHGHLTPGGGFQGGAVVASAFLLMYLTCRGKRIRDKSNKVVESLGGLIFVGIGLVGLIIGKGFLFNFLPKGEFLTLFSGGIIPIIYIAIGFKVGAELTGVLDNIIEESK